MMTNRIALEAKHMLTRILSGFRKRHRGCCVTVLVFVVLLVPSARCNSLSLQNFRNDPDLALAMEYDGEQTSDRSKADRAKAEEHYLAYLAREPESFQRARVYAQLGALHMTALNVHLGEKRDVAKGTYYFRKVLEEEPSRIDWPTLRARTMLAPHSGTRQEVVKARMDCYELVLSLDRTRLQERWLPLTPENTRPTEGQLEKITNTLGSLEESTAINMVATARNLPDRALWLQEIVRRFPGTTAANLAQKEAAKLNITLPPPPPSAKSPARSHIIAAAVDPNATGPDPDPAWPISQPDTPAFESDASVPPLPAQGTPLAAAPPAAQRSLRPWLVPLAALAILSVLAGALVAHRRTK